MVDIITGHQAGELVKTFGIYIIFTVVNLLISQAVTYFSNKISISVDNSIKADIFDKMRANGIGKRTVEQAKKDMGIISYKLGDKWYWQLNGSDASGERI